MSSTPICDFVAAYARKDPLRLHMPGHKGAGPLGVELRDITEIPGADDLYHAQGIIAESEANASALFGCPTFYSTEGSSHCIRAMLYLAARASGETRPLVLAGRNAHKTFLTAAALLDLRVQWLLPKTPHAYHSCPITAQEVRDALSAGERPCALYLTSPDYLGNLVDLAPIAQVCREYGVLLLVDNAHGAYLKFLRPSLHPMDLGADLCCDSAHKTLPVLTGGAYLHVRTPQLAKQAKDALALFGSTSPSYLIMQSLDAANPYLEALPEKLSQRLPEVAQLKERLQQQGFSLIGQEPWKLTLAPKSYGYTGQELAELLAAQGIVCEFADPDYLVCMVGFQPLDRLDAFLTELPRRTPIPQQPPAPSLPRQRLTPREALFAPCETLPTQQCLGRTLTALNVGCPPAIPIVMCGEEIDEAAIGQMMYYGILECSVVTA